MDLPSEQEILDAVERLALQTDDRRNPVWIKQIPTALEPEREPDDAPTLFVIRNLLDDEKLELARPGMVALPH